MKRLLHTALLAVLILAVGISVLYGVRAVLPDYTNEIHAHSMTKGQLLPVFEQQAELVLYPWKELTQTESMSKDSDHEGLFYVLCDAFDISVSYLDFGNAEICYSADGMTGGVRNVYAYMLPFEELQTDAETEQIAVSESVILSAAFENGVLCYFLAEHKASSSEADIQNGYDALCAYAQKPLDAETPFAVFAKNYANACAWLGTDGAQTAETLMASGTPDCYLYGGRAYIRYTADGGSLTLICDPVSIAVIGFSLETA